MSAAAPVNDTVLALRANFDAGFARAPQAAGAERAGMLAIRIGGQPYALRLAQIGGLHADRRIVALPSPAPALRGVTGFRGQVVPVYDLALLLGHARSAAPRWLVQVRCADPLALAFDHFEAHFTAAPEQFIGATVQAAEGARPVIDLASLHEQLLRQSGLARPQGSIPI